MPTRNFPIESQQLTPKRINASRTSVFLHTVLLNTGKNFTLTLFDGPDNAIAKIRDDGPPTRTLNIPLASDLLYMLTFDAEDYSPLSITINFDEEPLPPSSDEHIASLKQRLERQQRREQSQGWF